MADDGIENDRSQGVNQVIWGNFVSQCNFGLSPNPMFTGPIYVLYNLFDSNDAADVKFGGNSTAAMFFYHNTMTSASCHSAADDVGGGVKNVVFRNNLFVTADVVPCFRYPFMDGGGGLDTTVTSLGPIFDHNMWYAGNPRGEFMEWKGIVRKWNYLRNVLGWEAHGIVASPTFVDSAADDFRPTPDSPQINRGTRILGINTRNKTGLPLYQGFPDLGANELGLISANQPALPVSGPGPENPFSPEASGPPFAWGATAVNPSRSGTVLRLSLPHQCARGRRRVRPQWPAHREPGEGFGVRAGRARTALGTPADGRFAGAAGGLLHPCAEPAGLGGAARGAAGLTHN
jgi:hypothetical protein